MFSAWLGVIAIALFVALWVAGVAVALRILFALEARFNASTGGPGEVSISVGRETIFRSDGLDVFAVDDAEKWRQLAGEIEPWLRKHSGGEFLPRDAAHVDGAEKANDFLVAPVGGNALGILSHEDSGVSQKTRVVGPDFFPLRGGEDGFFNDDNGKNRSLFLDDCCGKLHRAIAALRGLFTRLISRAAGSADCLRFASPFGLPSAGCLPAVGSIICSGGNMAGGVLEGAPSAPSAKCCLPRLDARLGFFTLYSAFAERVFRAQQPAASGRRGVSVAANGQAALVFVAFTSAALFIGCDQAQASSSRKDSDGSKSMRPSMLARRPVARPEIDFTLPVEAMDFLNNGPQSVASTPTEKSK